MSFYPFLRSENELRTLHCSYVRRVSERVVPVRLLSGVEVADLAVLRKRKASVSSKRTKRGGRTHRVLHLRQPFEVSVVLSLQRITQAPHTSLREDRRPRVTADVAPAVFQNEEEGVEARGEAAEERGGGEGGTAEVVHLVGVGL
jgi:hypothetical protein